MFLNSYRKKLIGLFTLIAMVPIILFAVSVYTRINTYIIEENIKAKTSFIENEAEKLDIWFMTNEEKVKDISVNYPFIKELMAEEDGDRRVNEYLSSQLTSSKEILSLRVVMVNSKEYSSKRLQSIGDPRLKHDYINALLKKELVWTLQEVNSGHPSIITASVPFFGVAGEIEGVLLVDFSFDGILNRIGEIKRDDKSVNYVLTKQGNILSGFGKEIIESRNVIDSYEKKISSLAVKTVATDVGTENIELDKEYLAFYSTVPSVDWKIMSLIPKSEIYNGINVLVKYASYITAITLLSIVILAMLFSKIFSEPLVKLKNGAIEIQKGNYDYKFDIKKEDEFGQVALAFNDMVSKLKKSHEDLSDNNAMLTDANEQLQKINLELEASYEQLKATTDQLNESEQRFRTLLGNIDDLVWIMDRDLNIIFTNDQVETVLRTNKERFLGRNLNELTNYIIGNGETLLNDIVETDLDNREIYITNGYKDTIIVEANTKRVYENNKLVGIHGVIRDITERKKMEESIIKRNEELIVVNRVSKGLTTAMNIETLMQRAVDGIIRLMNISLCTIRQLEDNKLILKAFSGAASNLITSEDIPIAEDDIGEAAKTGKIQVLEIGKQYHKSKYTEKLIDSGRISYLSVLQIKARGKISGVMVVGSKGKLDKGEFNVLASITNQIALITENISLYQGLKNNYLRTIETLAAAIEAKDEYTEGHSNRVAKYSVEIAKYMGMPKKFCEEIEFAGILHDVGKIGIKDGVLTKPGRLTEREYEMIRMHPVIGSRILEGVGFSDTIMNVIKFHHKRYDLKGYPLEIYIEELPLEAAIVGVADAFDAMTTSRAYRSAITPEEAIEELIRNKESQFNPYIVDIMTDIYRRNKKVIETIMHSDIVSERTSLA